MAKFKWEDTSSWSRGDKVSPADEFSLKLPSMRINVHRHVHYGPTVWLMTCRALDIDKHTLTSLDLQDAQKEALQIARTVVTGMLKELSG